MAETVFKLVLATAGASSVTNALASVQTGWVKLAATVAAAAGGLAVIRKGLAIGGALEDLRIQTGQSVKDLVKLQSAFELSGISANKLGDSVARLHKSIDTAMTQGATARAKGLAKEFKGLEEEGYAAGDAFERLGLRANELKNLTAHQQFEALAKAFEKIPSPVERSAVAMQIFGKSGAEMVRLFAAGGALEAPEYVVRLANRLEDNAAVFDKTDDELTAINVHMKEFFVVIAEKGLPVVTALGTALKSINLAPIAAGLGTGGAIALPFIAATMANDKLNDKVLAMASNPLIAGSLRQNLANGIKPLTGALANALPVGLAVAVGLAITAGIYSAYKEWKDAKLDRARTGADMVKDVSTSAGSIRFDQGAQDVKDKAIATRARIQEMLAEEQSKFLSTSEGDAAIASYQSQIAQLSSLIRMVGSDWGKIRIETNLAADAAAEFKEREGAAAEWLAGTEAEAARKRRADAFVNGLDLEEQLAVHRFDAGLLEQSAITEAKRLELAGKKNQAEVFLLKAGEERAKVLEKILDLETKVAQKQVDAAGRALETQLLALGERRAKLDGDFATTDAAKWGARRDMLREEVALQTEYIDNLKRQRALATTDAAKATFTGAIQSGSERLSGLRGQQSQLGPNPNSFGQNMTAGITSAGNQIGTFAQQASGSLMAIGESFRTSFGSAVADAIWQAQSFRDVARGVWTAIGQAVVQQGAQIVANEIYRHTVLRAMRAVFRTSETAAEAAHATTQVAIHTGAEVAKTGATATGATSRGVLRFGETIFHGVQVAARTAAHITGEVIQTATTIAQYAIRLPVILAESAIYLVKAGIGALSAMASIPYVGPFLAIGAMAAVIAAGSKVIKGYEHGGIISGGEQIVRVNENGEESVLNARATRMLGPSFINRANRGNIDYDALVGAQIAPPVSRATAARESLENLHRSARTNTAPAGANASGAQPGAVTNVAFYPARDTARRELSTRQGRKFLVEAGGDNRWQMGIPS